MDVYLVRHAVAHERNRARWPDDSKRTLTDAGRRKFARAARGLALLLPKGAAVFTSPFVRARDTAAILVSIAGLGKPIEAAELAADAAVNEAFEFLRSRRSAAVVFVGHEPNLGLLLATCLAGTHARFAVEFKKGGAVCLRFGKVIQPGRATLRWMLPPRVLRNLR